MPPIQDKQALRFILWFLAIGSYCPADDDDDDDDDDDGESVVVVIVLVQAEVVSFRVFEVSFGVSFGAEFRNTVRDSFGSGYG